VNRCDNCGRRHPTLHAFKDMHGRIVAWVCSDCAEQIAHGVAMVARATRSRRRAA